MFEILLTRIFSVTMWYHFAFMAISVAMFGMTVGALIVYLCPHYFVSDKVHKHLSLSSFYFSIAIVFSSLTHLVVPIVFKLSFMGIYSMIFTYTVISIPFIFSGICVCLVLTKFPGHVSGLYATDLAGAALGCIMLLYTLDIFDGPTVVLIVSIIAGIGSIFFALQTVPRKLIQFVSGWTGLLILFTAYNAVMAIQQTPIIRLIWVKGILEGKEDYIPIYEKWNSYSRIAVYGDPTKPVKPFGWGLSSAYTSDRKILELFMNIDANAGTPITGYHGKLENLEYLKYDITNIAHYIKQDAKVLVVGTGGGRDILSALLFDQKSVTGVEINNDIIQAVNREFADFSGHLDRDPKVRFVNDEARSYIARSREKFDIIQVSLIDTWAATAAGAFVLTENSLYTAEAWNIFLNHLTPNGVLSFSRWYFHNIPDEVYRLTSLASASLIQQGIKDPRQHIIIVKYLGDKIKGVGTMLVSKEPFSNADLDTVEEVVDKMKFELVLTPRFALDSTFVTLASGKDLYQFTAHFPINIAPPTDDSPFFFNMVRLKNIFHEELTSMGAMEINIKAVAVLGALLFIVIGLTTICIIVPLLLTTDKSLLKGAFALTLFFACIGFGFMFVEISQMQRLIIFLGHPVYGLSVVLFGLLIFSGLGSYLTQKIYNLHTKSSALLPLFFIPCALFIIGIITPSMIKLFQSSVTPLRIFVATALLFPIGIFMGMAFPLGMKLASNRSTALTPWLWGINGATSVCASVLAIVIALNSSITSAYWTGCGCYVTALISFMWASRKSEQ